MSKIKHVVYYMLENRSFDNVLGWLYDQADPPKNIIASPDKKQIAFMGLEENKYFNQFDGDDTKHYVQKGTESMKVPSPDPHESYANVCFELFEKKTGITPGEVPTMGGFLQDYSTAYTGFKAETAVDVAKDAEGFVDKHASFLAKAADDLDDDVKKYVPGAKTVADDVDDETEKALTITKQQALQIMQTYSPEQLPVINGIAKGYAVSDEWFSSVPSQTNCNRAFSICGTSCGLVNNEGSFFGLKPSAFKTNKSIFEVLTSNGHGTTDDWMVFYQTLSYSNTFCYTQEAFNVPNGDDNVAKIDQFFELAAAGKLPKFSYLEPDWIGVNMYKSGEPDTVVLPKLGEANGNSYHPPAQLQPGEVFLKKLYDSMTSTPEAKAAWENTLLIITFDEHGGTYDHVPPPWGAAPPWGDRKPEFELEGGFGFDRFGIRVPTILASPLIEEGTVFRSLTDVPYDHTSMIATVLDWFGVPRDQWELGERVANAPTFDNVLTLSEARTDFPEVQTAPEADTPTPLSKSAITDLHHLIMPKTVAKMVKKEVSEHEATITSQQILSESNNLQEVSDKMNSYISSVKA